MKRLLGSTLLLAAVLTGCGDTASSDVAQDPADQASSPTSRPSSSPTTTPSGDVPTTDGGAVDFQEVAILSQTAAAGHVDDYAVRLDDEASREAFVAQFETPGLGNKITRTVAATTVPSGHAIIGAVVSIGCDVPPGVYVTSTTEGWVITPQKVPSPLQECFAAVTTVAIVTVPA